MLHTFGENKLAQGRAEGVAQELSAVVRSMLRSRGIHTSEGFPGDLATFAGAGRDVPAPVGT